MNNSIGVVLVTFNRLNKLKNALTCYDKQTYKPKYIIVVNNASTDGTYQYLEKWKESDSNINKIVINCNENLGGSGGFYVGLEKAMQLELSEWIWVSDDDAYPQENAFFETNSVINNHKNEDISIVCGIVNEHGNIAKSHRKNIIREGIKIKEKPLDDEAYKHEFTINSCTYVGSAINLQKLKEVGLPRKDYFIWYDDAEHTMRLSKVGKIICNPNIVIEHDNQISVNKKGINWMKYYGVRNSYDFYMKNFPSYLVNLKFNINLIRVFIKSISKFDFAQYKQYKQALYDAKHGFFGKSDKYFPGMK